MAVAVASAPTADMYGHGHVGNGSGLKGLLNLGGPQGGAVSNGYNSGHFNMGEVLHHGHELRCSKCSCLPIDCQCVESHQVGQAYCPNPNEVEMEKQYETHVQVVVRVPEMVEVEETRYRKEVCFEKKCVAFPKSVVTYDEVEHIEMVPCMRMVTKTRPELIYHVVEEEIEVTVIEQCVEYEDVCVIRQEPQVITEECEEVIQVPVVKEVKVTKMCEEWTGKYCVSEVEKFHSSGDFNLICEDSCHMHSPGHHIYRNDSLSDSASTPERRMEKI